VIDDPFLTVENVAPRGQVRIVADHLRGDVEGERGLVLVGGRAVDFRADFPVEEQPIDRERGDQFRLPVFARHHQQAHPMLALPRRAVDREERPDDPPDLPAAEVEQLPRGRAFRVG
jgi:hypothetical protein